MKKISIIMGSDSDLNIMSLAADTLKEFDIELYDDYMAKALKHRAESIV